MTKPQINRAVGLLWITKQGSASARHAVTMSLVGILATASSRYRSIANALVFAGGALLARNLKIAGWPQEPALLVFSSLAVGQTMHLETDEHEEGFGRPYEYWVKKRLYEVGVIGLRAFERRHAQRSLCAVALAPVVDGEFADHWVAGVDLRAAAANAPISKKNDGEQHGRILLFCTVYEGLRVLRSAALAAALLVAPMSATAATLHEPFTASGVVANVRDGDTFTLDSDESGRIVVRFAGIDAPERGQAFSRQSREFLREAVRGRRVRTDCYKRDDHDREICRVFIDADDLGLRMLRAGMAWHFKRFESEQTQDERAEYDATQMGARNRRRGLWRDDVPMPPWECRKLRRERGRCK